MQSEFYKLHRQYSGGDFIESLPKELTYQKTDWYKRANPRHVVPYMFEGVEAIKYKEPPIVEELNKKKPISDRRWKQNIYDKLKEIVFNQWDTTRFHVVAHSGGVDSRILSTIIKELAEQHGREWLGDVLFVENGGEGEIFKRIMQTLRWNKKQYLSYKYGQDPKEFHREGLNFENFYKKFNGPVSYPYNVFYDCYDELIKKGIIPEDFQGFAAFGCYIDLAFRGSMSLRQWFEWDYHYQMHSFRLKGKWIFPWWHYDYMREIAKYVQVRQLGRVRISDVINPWPTIPNVPYGEIIKKGYRHLGIKLFEDVMVDYFSSWYGQRFNADPDNEIRYCNWWGQ